MGEKNELDYIYGAPIDPDGRSLKNVYSIIKRHGMHKLENENTFGKLFGLFERIKKKEIEMVKKIS